MATRKLQNSKPAATAIDPDLAAQLAECEASVPGEATRICCDAIRGAIRAGDANAAAEAAYGLGQLVMGMTLGPAAAKEEERTHGHKVEMRSVAGAAQRRKLRARELFVAYSEKERRGRLTPIYKEIAAKLSAEFPPRQTSARTVRRYLGGHG